MNYTAIIADDHPIFVEALVTVLRDIGLEVAGVAATGPEAIALARRHAPRLVTLDLAMPLTSGVETLVEVRRWSPAADVAVVTGGAAPGILRAALDVGAAALLSKVDAPDDLRRALRAALSGQRPVSPVFRAALGGGDEPSRPTPREMQVLGLVAQGRSNAEIGARLAISAKTVGRHRENLMARLGVHSTAELLIKAIRDGLIDP